MPELVEDIKKIDPEKIREGREILLKYLAEVDQATVAKAKIPEKKPLPEIRSKPAEIKLSPPTGIPPRPTEAKIDFVKDFRSAESKLSKPITEIIHDVMVKSAPDIPPETTAKMPAVKAIKDPTAESKVEKIFPEKTPVYEKPRAENVPALKKIVPPVVKKLSRKKRTKIERTKNETREKQGAAAVNFLGRLTFKFLSAASAIAIVYFVFCLSLYTFGFDNGASRFITKIFPVPAFITQYGVVNYYAYLDAKNAIIKNQPNTDRALGQVLASIEARETLIKRLILTGLAKNYGLRADALYSSSTASTLENKLALMIAADPAINTDSLRKLRAVKSALLGGADFTLTAQSFGLEAKTEYFSIDAIKEKFGQKALNLASISTIETSSVRQGYYIFQFYNQQDGLTGFKYIFVPAKTLEMLIAEKFKAANLIILAN